MIAGAEPDEIGLIGEGAPSKPQKMGLPLR